ncbi:superoxide dismutase family protein [Segetibacter sp. 3557_3]|uniref:superoxide dismutase family protein n=1 Tax=Segetibacter sp. 3557_3 TaxID=2547429 RepID=UPI001A9F1473|nr:superoxide dismutase family protein [Segetibacter sp. 3557_3]
MINSKASLRTLSVAAIAFATFGFMACGNEQSTTTEGDSTTTGATTGADSSGGTTALATLTGTQPDTTLAGTARFDEQNGKVKMTIEITVAKKANQSVAVHLHEHGNCGDMGKEAHGHWNPTKVNHGKWGADPFHRGDIGNIELDGEGKGRIELETDLWSINGTDSTKNILNKAVIIHGGVDDYKTQPTGNAGSRIGCGVIAKGS